jgi:hypothetical protein
MSELTKTITFVVVAVVAGIVAWFSQPANFEQKPDELLGQVLFPDFKDPLAVTSLEIVQYDEDTARVRPFKVAKVKNRWVIPSHESYPADAKDQLAEAAAGLIDLKVLSVAADDTASHAMYGVVDPDPKTLQAGATGVGTRVILRDAADKTLLALIVGKQVKDKSDLYYVRRVGQDQVCTVALKNTNKLSSRFEDWIEKDLLKLSAWDIQQVEIRDYSIDLARGVLNHRGELSVQYNDAGDPKWKLVSQRQIDPRKGTLVDVKLADTEEVNAAALDDMKNAVGDLKIVDVRPKPKGLSADLKAASDFMKSDEAAESLGRRGFHIVPLGGQAELLSNQGEVRCRMKDGVEYVLRFGDIAGDTAGGQKKLDKKDEKKDEKKEEKKGANRYIMVTTQFNKDAIAKPELEKLPALEEKKAYEKKPADKKDAAKKDEKKADKKDAAKPDVKAERERIEKENKRKQDEYDDKVKKGEGRVKELNARFADWYYVISDDVYQKIHLGRSQIVKKKEKKDEKAEAGHDHDHDHDHGAPGKKAGFSPEDFKAMKDLAPGPKK